MTWQNFPYLAPYFASLGVTALVMVFVYVRRRTVGARAYQPALAAELLWTAGFIAETVSSSLEDKVFWDNIQFIGTFALAVAYIRFALLYSNYRQKHPHRNLILLSLPLVAALAIIFLAPYSEAVRPTYKLIPNEPFSVLFYDYGLPVWASYLYSYALIFSALFIMADYATRQRAAARAQTITILIGAFIPVLGTILTLAGVTIGGQRDFVAITFTFSNFVIAWGLFRYGLFGLVPLARDSVIERMSEPVIMLDEQDRLADLNPAAQDLLGTSVISLAGQPARQALPFWDSIPNRHLNHQPIQAEIAVPVHGTQRYFDLRLTPVTGQNNELRGRVLLLYDITRRKQAEDELRRARDELEQRVAMRTAELTRAVNRLEREVRQRQSTQETLRASEEKFRAIIEQSSDGFLLIDEQGIIIEVNAAYERLTELDHEQIIGRSYAEVASGGTLPEVANRIHARLDRTLRLGDTSGYPRQLEVTSKHKDGRTFYLLQTIFPIRTSSGLRLASFTRDITIQKQAEAALRESEEKFRTIIEQSAEGFMLVDREGMLIEVNAAAERIIGLNRAELTGQPMWEVLARITVGGPSQMKVMSKNAVQDAVKTGQSYMFERPIESVARLPDGSLRYLLQTIFPIRTSHGIRLAATIRDITDQKQAQMRLQRELEKLNGLRQIDTSITSGSGLQNNLDMVLEQACKHLEVSAGRILLLNESGAAFEYAAGFGLNKTSQHGLSDPGSLAWQAIDLQKITQSSLEKGSSIESCDCFEEGFTFCVAAPLLVKGRPEGVLEIFHTKPLSPDPDWVSYLETLAGQAAIAVDNDRLVRDLQRSNRELVEAYEATISGWAQALELRDKETRGHSERVTRLATRLAQRLGMSDEELTHFRRGVLLHDIGKMAVPDSILLKPGPLTEEEWVVMRQHVQYAFNLLDGIPYLKPALDVAYCHHEFWNGAGYPRGLKGIEIPLGARIFAVVDVYDALTSERPYRPAWARDEVLKYIAQLAGTQLDPDVVREFLIVERG